MDIRSELKTMMEEKRCNATCAFVYVSNLDKREAQKSCDSEEKKQQTINYTMFKFINTNPEKNLVGGKNTILTLADLILVIA